MKIILLILLTILLLPNNCFSQSLFSKVFGAKDYDECILLRIDSDTNAIAAKLIQKSCRNKFPKKTKPVQKPQEIPSNLVHEKVGGDARLYYNSNEKNNNSVSVKFINKFKNWMLASITIQVEFNADGQDETIELTTSSGYSWCGFQEECEFNFYKGIPWEIRKNYKGWWIVKLKGIKR